MTTRREMASTIASLQASRGRHTGMVSMYVPPSSRVSDVRAYVREEMVESENVKDKANRKNVVSSLTSIFS